MEVRVALRSIAKRAAVSVVAGLIVSAFAAAALVVGAAGPADRLAVGRTIWGSLAPVFAAVSGAGFLAGVVVFACLVANDVVRGAGPWVVRSARPWLVAQRGWLLGPLRAIGWLVAATALAVVLAVQFVVRSAVIADLVWLIRTVGRPMALALGYATLVGLCAIFYVGLIVIGFACVGESTRTVVSTLEDPPRPMAMVIVIGGATVLMYVGIAAFTVCGWVAYHWTRAGLRSAAARGRPFVSVPSR